MDAKRRKTTRFHPRLPVQTDVTYKDRETSSFAGLNPVSVGLQGPGWFSVEPSGSEHVPEAVRSSADEVPHLSSSSLFESPAPVEPAPARTLLEGLKVVCICQGIKKSTFWKALDAGARTIEDINRVTSAGSGGCNGRRCGPRIREMLRDFSQ